MGDDMSSLPMLSVGQLEYVRKELRKLTRAQRRRNVYDAFLLMMCRIRDGSGVIELSRKEFAEELGIAVRTVSAVMTTLEQIGVVVRVRKGRTVTYFVNEKVAWEKLPGEE